MTDRGTQTHNPLAGLHIGHGADQFGRPTGGGSCSGCGKAFDHGGGDKAQAARAQAQANATTSRPGPFTKNASLEAEHPGRVPESVTCRVCGRPTGNATLRPDQPPPTHGAPGPLARAAALAAKARSGQRSGRALSNVVTGAKGSPKTAKGRVTETARAKAGHPDDVHASRPAHRAKPLPPGLKTGQPPVRNAHGIRAKKPPAA